MNNRALFAVVWMCTSVGLARAETSDFACGSLQNAYGPYDFRTDKDKLSIVVSAHLTPEVINLVKGKTGPLGGDIDYTLRAIPNHPSALMAMVRLGAREKAAKPRGARYTVECYLYRANRFRGDDPTVKMIYANYLARNGKGAEALRFLDEAVALGEESANLNYNIGLVYLDLKQYEKALTNAHLAYQKGFPLPGLRNRLKMEGKWSEPTFVVESRNHPNSNDEPSHDSIAEKPVEGTPHQDSMSVNDD